MAKRKVIKAYLWDEMYGNDIIRSDLNYIGEIIVDDDWEFNWCWMELEHLKLLLQGGTYIYSGTKLVAWKNKKEQKRVIDEYFVKCL